MPEEKEMVDQTGLVSVEKELFTPESVEDGEGVQSVQTQDSGEGEGEEAGTEVSTGQQPATQEAAKPGAVEVVEPEKLPAGQQPAQAGQAPRVYADKFKTEEDLRHAFINLGGNPNRYPTVERLEEAYEVRQQEYTRARQEEAERRRINQNIDNRQPTPGQNGNPSDMEALLDKVNWDKVENARDLGRELIGLMSQIAPKNQPSLPSEAELVEKIMPLMQEREARANELREIETDIPRLRAIPGQENPFRDEFARRVMAEKQTGTFISLRKSMTNFLNWAEDIVKEKGLQKGFQQEQKMDAAPLSDRGAGLPTGGQADEIDAIIGSFKARKDKLGEL